MPRFEYPDVPADKPKNEAVTQASPMDQGVFPSQWEREIRVPVNAEILQGLQVGDEIEVTLRGTVTQLSSDSGSNVNRSYLTVLTQAVEAYPAEDMSDETPQDSFTRGFGRGPGQLGRRKSNVY